MGKSIEEKVRTVIADQLGLGDDEMPNSARIIEDLGADSLDAIELLMAIEEEFEVEIPDEDMETIHTVGDAVRYVERNLR